MPGKDKATVTLELHPGLPVRAAGNFLPSEY